MNARIRWILTLTAAVTAYVVVALLAMVLVVTYAPAARDAAGVLIVVGLVVGTAWVAARHTRRQRPDVVAGWQTLASPTREGRRARGVVAVALAAGVVPVVLFWSLAPDGWRLPGTVALYVVGMLVSRLARRAGPSGLRRGEEFDDITHSEGRNSSPG